MKAVATDTLLRAIRQVLNGGTYLSETMRTSLSRRSSSNGQTGCPLDALSDRELEIFRLIGLGKTTHEIAELFSVTQKTVESHRTHVRQKLKLGSATELIQFAIRISDDPSGVEFIPRSGPKAN